MQPTQNCIGPSIRIGREILGLPYAGFFNQVLHVRCHISGVRYHISGVRYHMSPVTCHISQTPKSTARDSPPTKSPTMHSRMVRVGANSVKPPPKKK